MCDRDFCQKKECLAAASAVFCRGWNLEHYIKKRLGPKARLRTCSDRFAIN